MSDEYEVRPTEHGSGIFRAGDGTPGPAREAALTEAEVEAVSWFFQYGATRGNHSDEGRGPSPGPLTPHIDAMASAMRKIRALASGDSGGPREAVGYLWRHEKYGLHVAQPDEKMNEEWSIVGPVYLRAELGRAPNVWEQAGPSDEMEKLKAHLVIVENGYREAAHYILNYGRADHTDWKARAQRILDTTPGGCTPWLSELLALRAELARAPNGWEEAAKVCEEAQAEMKGTRWSGAAACIRALRARADAERREPAP